MMLSEAGVATTDKWEDEGPIHLNTVFPDAALTAISPGKRAGRSFTTALNDGGL